MILFPDRKLLLLTPPKTASESLHQALCRELWGGYHGVGPDPLSYTGYSHTACVRPDQAHTWRVLGTVRHPLDRLVSLWHHYQRGEAYHGRAGMDFRWFVGDVCADVAAIHAWFRLTAAEHLAACAIDGVLHTERLQADLEAEGFADVMLPRINPSFRRPWRDYYDDATIALARQWGRRDAELGGYDLT